jgi:hypothetical protein
MELSNDLLFELQRRLKVGDRKRVHLNAIPKNSRFKLDISKLRLIGKNLPEEFLKTLLESQSFKFRVSWKDNVSDPGKEIAKQKTPLSRISTSLENLINQADAIEQEKGINTLGFGFPLLVRRDKADGKLTVAPLLIWSLRMQRTGEFNTWEVIRKEEDSIYINEVLLNHLETDSQVRIAQIPSEMLEDGLIDKQELVKLCSDVLKELRTKNPDNLNEIIESGLNKIQPIEESDFYETLVPEPMNVELIFGGLFSIFEVQKQSIIKDFDRLLQQSTTRMSMDDLKDHEFQSITSVDTDPSQQGIVNALDKKRNVVVQGPPGTGKSQTLTAVLINALENHKKVLVVCEKRTALEVLQNALNGEAGGRKIRGRGLSELCVLIKDAGKDRRTIVDEVRSRLDGLRSRINLLNTSGRNTPIHSREMLDNLLLRIKTHIVEINNKHKKIDRKILGDKNWTDTVGALLLAMDSDADFRQELDYTGFSFNASEFEHFISLITRGEPLFRSYAQIDRASFLDWKQLQQNNPYLLKDQIETAVKKYTSTVDELVEMWDKRSFLQKIYFPRFRKGIKNLNEQIARDAWLQKHPGLSSGEHADLLAFRQQLQEMHDYLSDDYFFDEYNWARFYINLNELEKRVIEQLKSKENWRSFFIVQYLHRILQSEASTGLPHNDFDWNEYAEIHNGLEKEQLKYILDYWLVRQADSIRDFEKKYPDLSVANLYNKRSSSKFKRLTLRQIVQMAPDLFTAFYPVVLTTPEVCCNLFGGVNADFDQYFDIVMFDEASQLRLEDNLPAMLKGKQIIVSGDEHQMPPSSYFAKMLEGSIESEEDDDVPEEEVKFDKNNIFLGCESLLDFANELKFDKRHLDFHYRSKHPFLIDFSNHAFYGGRLKPMPSSYDYNPINFEQVDGSFIGYINEAEADKVLHILENEIHPLSDGNYPSVGVATFNIHQRDLILSKIAEKQKYPENKEFKDKIIALQSCGFFVKNLENIQGDERDIIILSTTYGPGKDGKFVQRFGPVSRGSKGYKLLNVIITRAKIKVFVCSSIPLNYVNQYQEALKAEGANNRYAVLYAYLAYAKAVSESNHEARLAVLQALADNAAESKQNATGETDNGNHLFEEAIQRVLAKAFGEEKVLFKESFAGITLDVILPPHGDKPGIVIECDANKDHASKEAYLLDYHRKKMLEKQGYHFIRIWSVNWWRKPKQEAQKLTDAIKAIYSAEDTAKAAQEANERLANPEIKKNNNHIKSV